MSSASIVTCLLAATIVLVASNDVLVDMDEDAATPGCGGVYLLNHTSEIRVVSKGKAAKGYCGLTVFTPSEEVNRFMCDGICVTFRSSALATCSMKVKFTGHYFREAGDISRVFDCHHSTKEPWCLDVNSLRVEVIESYQYAYVWNKRLYAFDFDVSPQCTRDKKQKDVYSRHSGHEAKEKQTYIEGLMVGVGLALFFLLILLILYCYYKNKATHSERDSDKEDKSSKRELLGRSSRSSSKTTEGTYRKRDDEESVQCGTSTMKSEYHQAASEFSAKGEETRPLTTSDSNYELAHESAKPSDAGLPSESSENAGNGTVSDTSTVVVNSDSREKLEKGTEDA